MNASFPKRCSDHLADQLDSEKLTDTERLDRAFVVIYGRLPEKAEREQSLKFLQQMSEKYVATGLSADDAHKKASSHLFQAMFSSNEFMFIE